jgi:hypothetical protein
VDDDSGRIDDPTELRSNLKIDLSLKEGKEVFEGETPLLRIGEFLLVEKLLTQSLQPIPHGIHHYRPGMGS